MEAANRSDSPQMDLTVSTGGGKSLWRSDTGNGKVDKHIRMFLLLSDLSCSSLVLSHPAAHFGAFRAATGKAAFHDSSFVEAANRSDSPQMDLSVSTGGGKSLWRSDTGNGKVDKHIYIYIIVIYIYYIKLYYIHTCFLRF